MKIVSEQVVEAVENLQHRNNLYVATFSTPQITLTKLTHFAMGFTTSTAQKYGRELIFKRSFRALHDCPYTQNAHRYKP